MEYPVESIRAGPMGEDWMNAELMTGTSIMAVEYDGGVVIGADSRTTTGTYIANRVTDKLTRITDTIYCCRSGSAADTQNIADIVAYHLDFMQKQSTISIQDTTKLQGVVEDVVRNKMRVETGEPPQVKTAANVFRELCYNYRDSLVAGVIVAGWDKRRGGQVYSVPIGGMCVRMPVTIGGSGSTYVYGYVDANFKAGMSQKECLQFVTNTLTLAMSRDGSSGGVVRLAAIGEKGVERHTVLAGELPRFYED